MESRTRYLIEGCLTPLVVFALLYSAFLHASQPYMFAFSGAQYRMLPLWAVGPLMLAIPYFQIVLALCIIARAGESLALGLSAGLFTVFAVAQATVLVRGFELSCGCFGFQTEPIGVKSISLAAGCTLICILLFGLSRARDSAFHNDQSQPEVGTSAMAEGRRIS